MKKIYFLFFIIGILGLITTQPSSGHGGQSGKQSQYNRMYNPNTVETISGEVVSVDKIPKNGKSYGIHLTLKTEKEIISVHLGPSWFIEKQSMKIAPEDKVEVIGSRITYEGKPAIIAAVIKKGKEELTLRDENGFPVWAGGKRLK